jgi:hypothetical protein
MGLQVCLPLVYDLKLILEHSTQDFEPSFEYYRQRLIRRLASTLR